MIISHRSTPPSFETCQRPPGPGQPLWRDQEIFFLDSGKVWAVDVQEHGAGVQLGTTHVLFSAPYQGNSGHWYDVTRDGKRFVINVSTQPQESGAAAEPCRELDGRPHKRQLA